MPAKPWSEVASSEQFQSLPKDERLAARQQYFDDVVKPQIEDPADHAGAWQQFSAETAPSIEGKSRSFSDKITAQAAEATRATGRFVRDSASDLGLMGPQSVMRDVPEPAKDAGRASPVAPMRADYYEKLKDAEREAPDAAAARAQAPDVTGTALTDIRDKRAALLRGQKPVAPGAEFDKDFNTKLSAEDEAAFQNWKSRYAPKDSGADYDLRGAFKAGLEPDAQTGHWPDTFKKPNHETFSDESKYAPYGQPGKWTGPDHDVFVPGMQPLSLRQRLELGRDKEPFENYVKARREASRLALDSKPLEDRVQGYLKQGADRELAEQMATRDVKNALDHSVPMQTFLKRDSAMGEWMQSVSDAFTHHLPADVAAAIKGDQVGATDKGPLDSLIERSEKRTQDRIAMLKNPDQQVLPGLTKRDLVEFGPNAGYTLAAGAIALGLGWSGPAASNIAGFEAMKRMDMNQVAHQMRDAANDESRATRGRALTDAEWQARLERSRSALNEHGNHEGLWEYGGTAAEIGILNSASKIFGKGFVTRLTSKVMALGGMEVASEAGTQTGQTNAEIKLGIAQPGEKPRSWLSWEDWKKSAKEVAPQTLLLTATMGGIGGGLKSVHERFVADPRMSDAAKEAASEGFLQAIPASRWPGTYEGVKALAARRPKDEQLQAAAKVFDEENVRRDSRSKTLDQNAPVAASTVLGQPEEEGQPATTDAPQAPAAAPAQAAGSIEDLLADPKKIFAAITARPAILDTIAQAVADMPVAPQQKADATAALKAMQADPKAIFQIATQRPEIYNTLTQAARSLDPSRGRAQAATAPQAAPAPAVGGSPQQAAVVNTHAQSHAEGEAARDQQVAEIAEQARAARMGQAISLEEKKADAMAAGAEVPAASASLASHPGVQRIAAEHPDARIEPAQAHEVPAAARQEADLISRAFGKKAVFVKADPSKYEGSMFTDDPSTFYVNVRAKRSIRKVMRHEVLHTLKRTNPKAYANLLRAVKGAIDKGAAAKAYEGYYAEGRPDPGDTRHVEEMMADIWGDRSDDFKFVLDVFRASDKHVAKKIYDALRMVLDILRMKLRVGERQTGYDTSHIVRDIEAVRKALATAYAEFQKAPTAPRATSAGLQGMTQALQSKPATTPEPEMLRLMAEHSGHIERGGKMIRDPRTGEVTGRTVWVGQPPWAKGFAMSPSEISATVEKHLAGKTLGPRQQNLIEAMLADIKETRENLEPALESEMLSKPLDRQIAGRRAEYDAAKDGRQKSIAASAPILLFGKPHVPQWIKDIEVNGTKPFAKSEALLGSLSTIYLKGRDEHHTSQHNFVVPESILKNLDDRMENRVPVVLPRAGSMNQDSFVFIVGEHDGKKIGVAIDPTKTYPQEGGDPVGMILSVGPRDPGQMAAYERAGLLLSKPKMTEARGPDSVSGRRASGEERGTPQVAAGWSSRSVASGTDSSTMLPKKETENKTLDARAHEAATSPRNELPQPTEAQKEAGNYPKGHVRVSGLDISIENPAGSTRTWKRKDGSQGETTMLAHYGYIRGTEGADGDHLDVFVKPGTPHDYEGPVFVADQTEHGTSKFDEHKVFLGWSTVREAHDAYKANYSKGFDGLESVVSFPSVDAFKTWLDQANLDKRAAGQEMLSKPQTPEFEKWFAGSKVVDANGDPLVVYHGTDRSFQVFGPGHDNATYFTSSPEIASSFAENHSRSPEPAPNVVPAYLSIKNPKVIAEAELDQLLGKGEDRDWTAMESVVAQARKDAYDGIHLVGVQETLNLPVEDQWLAFHPEQIKSVFNSRPTNSPDILLSRPAERLDAALTIPQGDVAGAWRELAKAEGIFQRAPVRYKSMSQIVKALIPGASVSENVNNEGREYALTLPDTSVAFINVRRPGTLLLNPSVEDSTRPKKGEEPVYEKRRTVEVDLSNLRTKQSKGSAVYDAAFTYAHNNGMTMIGDPAGITTIGAMRRVENMLSHALKMGTTAHMEPHKRMVSGSKLKKETGYRLIDWRAGDDSHNLTELLKTSYHNALQMAPEIGDITYDFDTHKFMNAAASTDIVPHGEMTNESFAKLASRANNRFWNRAVHHEAPQDALIYGVATLKRAAFTNTLVKSGESWPSVIAEVKRMAEEHAPASLANVLYSKPKDGVRMTPEHEQEIRGIAQRVADRVAARHAQDKEDAEYNEMISGEEPYEGYPHNFHGMPTPGERFHVTLEWDRLPNGDWKSKTMDGRYEIEQISDGFVYFKDGKEMSFHKYRNQAVASAHIDFIDDMLAGTIKNPNAAKAVTAQFSAAQQASVVSGWKRLAANQMIFRFKRSESKDLREVISDMGNSPVVASVSTDGGAKKERYTINFFDGTFANVIHDKTDNTAYLKANELIAGEQMGSVLYQAALQWAANNKIKIIPDPAGLTYINAFRRTEQMLSAALRVGTTKYMRPHPDQGLYGWIDKPQTQADEDHNLALMALTSMRNVQEHLPKVTAIHYDFAARRFEAETGQVIGKDDLDKLAKGELARNIGAGRTTIARAIFTESLAYDDEGAAKFTAGKLPVGAVLAGETGQSLQLYSNPKDRFAPREKSAPAKAILATAKGATHIARPLAAVLDVTNRVADLAAQVPGRALARLTGRAYDRLVTYGQEWMKKGEVRQQIAHGLASDYGLPEPYIDRRDERDIDIQRHLRKSKQLIDKIAALDDAESMVAYQWMQEKPNAAEEQRLVQLLPQPSRQTLVEMKDFIDSLGREAVALGLMSEETYARNKMAYLHRSYKKYEIENPQQAAASQRAKSIRAEHFRGRGLRDDVAASRVPGAVRGDHFVRLELRDPAATGLGRLKRVIYLKAGMPIPAAYSTWRNDGVWEARFMDKPGSIGMWRDFTRDERERMGEIREVRYAFARTMVGLVHDIETARFLKWVGEGYSVADEAAVAAKAGRVADAVDKMTTLKTYADDEWVQVPGTVAQGTRLYKYGLLQSRYIPGHIWNDIRATVNMRSTAAVWRIYDDLLRAWKVAKTALSPVVHTNNVMSNFVFMDLADVKHGHLVRSLQTLIDAERGSETAKALLERYLDSGAELGTPALHEIKKEVIEPLLSRLQGEENEVLAQLSLIQGVQLAVRGNFRQVWASVAASKTARLAAKPFQTMIAAYQMEDSVFRLATWIKEIEEGKSDRQAGEDARRQFLDYRINAPWIGALRRGPFPFLAFTYRAVPLLAEGFAKKPWKLMKYFAAGYAMNALAYAMLGLGGDDEDKERARMPDEKSGYTILGLPRLMRMPWNDEHGSPVFLDIRRWIPGGDIFDISGSHGAIPTPSWLSFGGYWALAIELASNKSQFTGKEIWKDSDTLDEKVAKVMDHLFKFAAPNIQIPNPAGYALDTMVAEKGLMQTYSWKSIMQAGGGATDDFGREKSVPQAIASSLGVKVAAYPEDQLERNIRAQKAHELKDLDETTARYKREHIRGGINDEEYSERMKKQASKRAEINYRYAKKLGAAPAEQ